MVRLLDKDGTITVMTLETYILGVVLKEMPADFSLEAIKAQAIAARTYTLRRYLGKSKHENADVCTDPSCCQAYSSADYYLQTGGQAEDVEYIREHYIPGDSEFGSRALGRKFNIEHSIILDIVKNKRYL